VSIALALDRGIRFLLAQQREDGLWRDFLTPAGEASEWTTGFVASALHRAGADGAALERAADALVARQNPDGGWGYNEEVPTDADSTAWVLLLLSRLAGREEARRHAAGCLATHRRDDGGVATYREPGPIREFMRIPRWLSLRGWCSPHTEVTAAAGLASPPSRDVSWRYVRPRQRVDGSWSSYWWPTPHYATQQAAELAASVGDGAALARAAAWAAANGGGGSAFAAALSLAVVADAGVPHDAALLLSLQADDGGWPGHAVLRIPMPGDRAPDRWRPVRLGRGIVARDQHRLFTTAACVAALARCTD